MPQHILVVDDESNIRRIVQVNLMRAGYRVTMAEDGVDGLEKIQQDRPDVIVLDVMMPRMDGFEMLRRVKADPATAEIPVIMLTARAQDQDIFEGHRSGALAYLTKPFSPPALLSALQEILKPSD